MTHENSPDSSQCLAIRRTDELARAWCEPMYNCDYRSAAEFAISAIKEVFSDSGNFASSRPESLFGVQVFLNGLRDIANLALIIEHDDWLDFPRAVDAAWSLAHDARSRIVNYGGATEKFCDYCSEWINDVFDGVQQRYGDGLYNSGEYTCDSIQCNICDDDIRACAHIGGNWYDGTLCRPNLEFGQVVAVAIVDNPRDPRCRIWPWQIDKVNGIIRGTRLIGVFNIEGGRDGGEVVDLESLFPTVRSVLRQPGTGIRFDVFAYRKLKRKELIVTVRKALAERSEKPQRNSRVRIVTNIGHDDAGSQ